MYSYVAKVCHDMNSWNFANPGIGKDSWVFDFHRPRFIHKIHVEDILLDLINEQNHCSKQDRLKSLIILRSGLSTIVTRVSTRESTAQSIQYGIQFLLM